MLSVRRASLLLAVFIFCAFVLSCAGSRIVEIADDFSNYHITRIAVLPPANLTADLDAPDLFRPVVENELRARGYSIVSPEEIDAKLADMGVHYAGELAEFTPDELGELFGADALLYTTVTDLKTIYLVGYAQITVGGRFELVSARDGKRLWLWEDSVTDIRIATKKEEIIDTTLFIFTPYKPYIEVLVRRAFDTLPRSW